MSERHFQDIFRSISDKSVSNKSISDKSKSNSIQILYALIRTP